MKTVSFNNHIKGIPDSFNELTLDQVRVYVREIEMRRQDLFIQEGGKTKVKDSQALMTAQCQLLFSLLGIPTKQFFQISKEQIRDLLVTSKLTEFYFNDHLTVNPLGAIGSWFKGVLYGPRESFHRLSFEEFGFADSAVMNYNITGEEKYLNELMAILYRRAKRRYNPADPATDGDIRQPFNHLNYELRIKAVERTAIDLKLVVYLWFSHCRLQLLERYKEVFVQHGEEGEAHEANSWVNTAMSLGGGVLNFHKIRKENVFLVFEEMKRLVTERQRLEEEMEARRNGSD